MKKSILLYSQLIIFAALPLLAACGGNDDNDEISFIPTKEEKNTNQENHVNSDNYYVKYEVKNGLRTSSSDYLERTIEFQDVDKKGTVTYTLKNQFSNAEWEGTYGPFKKDDKVFLKVVSVGSYNSNARLSVSKNKEAFTIKAEERESKTISLSYTIDY